jgi:hypothetical protein
MQTEITLTPYEMQMCQTVGRWRFENAEGRNHGLGPSATDRTPGRDMRAAACEYAASILVNRYWRPQIGESKPDVGGVLEVRSTDLWHGRLPVKPGDPQGPYALIFYDGAYHKFLGWQFASIVQQEPLLTGHGDPLHFMAQSKLMSIEGLVLFLNELERNNKCLP